MGRSHPSGLYRHVKERKPGFDSGQAFGNSGKHGCLTGLYGDRDFWGVRPPCGRKSWRKTANGLDVLSMWGNEDEYPNLWQGKVFDTKKTERYFKERRIKYQFIDVVRFGMRAGEYRNIKAPSAV